MSGPGSGGPITSSRLSRILQEKAEALKKKRQSAEALLKSVEERSSSLSSLGIAPPELAEGLVRLRELSHRSDWEQLEQRAEAILSSLALTVPTVIEGRRSRTEEIATRVAAAGVAVPAELTNELKTLAEPASEASWADAVGRLAQIEQRLKELPVQYVAGRNAKALEVARWAGLDGKRFAEFERSLPDPKAAADDSRLLETIHLVERQLGAGLPEAAARRQKARELAESTRVTAGDLGITTTEIEAALADGAGATSDVWPTTVGRIETAIGLLTEQLRARGAQAVEGMLTALAGLSEFGVDPTPAKGAVEAAGLRLGSAGPGEIAGILLEARAAAEEPIVAVVAGLLDEVRPRVASARRLGRDPSEVFGAMNRAREALRLKIYSEALAAGREALERVRRLTEDVDGLREELGSLEEMLGKFRKAGVASPDLEPVLARVRDDLDRGRVGPAKDGLGEAVRALGTDAVGFFLERWRGLDRVREFAVERGFVADGASGTLEEARGELDRGDLLGAMEHLASAELELRNAAAPYVARRVGEIEAAFAEVGDESLTAATRKHLADADVTLRVKEDVLGTVESLRRAEREFTSVFASRASNLVAGLEEEARTLEAMGATSEELQRQIDEVRQVFNVGDFVKASHAAQEIRARAIALQLVRSDEALSHSKLAVAELEAMGLDLGDLKSGLDTAADAARAGRPLDAWKTATRLETTSARHRAAAQTVLGRFARLDDLLAEAEARGVDTGPVAPKVAEARSAFRTLEFDRSRTLLDAVEEALGTEVARREADRRFEEIPLLIEEANRLALPTEPYVGRLRTLTTERPTAPPAATAEGTRLLAEELIALVRPALEENVKTLERDLDVARAAGVQLKAVAPSVAEARRRIALATPTGAAALLDQARSDLVATRGYVEQAERFGRRVREAVAQAEVVRANVAGLRSRAEEVEKRLEARDYARVIELGAAVERDFAEATHQHVAKTLAVFQASVAQLRRTGGETSVAENLLHQARAALEDGKAVEALQLAVRSEYEIERVELQRKLAQGAVEAASKSVERAKKDGFETPDARTALAEVEGAFARADYPGVLEQAISVYDTLSLAREGLRHAREAIEVADHQVREAGTLDADAAEAAAHLAEAREELSVGHFAVAVRLGRESAEMARWAIERTFTGPLGELRTLLEVAEREGARDDLAALEPSVADAETAVREAAWTKARTLVGKAWAQATKLVAAAVDRRWSEFEAQAKKSSGGPNEVEGRAAAKAEVDRHKEARDLGEALRRIRAESAAIESRRNEEAAKTLADLKERLWVGERLGVDTAPMMQAFGEARVALDAGKTPEARRLVAEATDALTEAVKAPLARRRKDVQSEVAFAEGGMHVVVDPVKERLKEVVDAVSAGRTVEAGKILLQAEEELSLRKSLHRELTNLQYVVETALARGEEAGADVHLARQLLTESMTLRASDYVGAIEKARAALRELRQKGLLEGEAAGISPSAFWPFVRPPPGPGSA